MLRTLALVVLGASVVLTPLAALAQNAPPPASAEHRYSAHKPTGSYRSHMRNTRDTSKQRARASAEHVRMMRSQ